MRIDILTLFPEMFTSFLEGSLIGAVRSAGLLDIRVTNIRDFATGLHRQVDDRPFGGGPGMLLMAGPVVECVEDVQQQADAGHLVMLTPGGRRLDQAIVEELATHERLVLVCGRYEGFDERVKAILAPDEISIGDYVLSGGEVAAMVIVDAVSRLVPGVLGDEESTAKIPFPGPIASWKAPSTRGRGSIAALRCPRCCSRATTRKSRLGDTSRLSLPPAVAPCRPTIPDHYTPERNPP